MARQVAHAPGIDRGGNRFDRLEDLLARPLLRRSEIESITTMGRMTLIRAVNAGAFPKPVRISPRLIAWKSADVKDWLESLDHSKGAA